jgi:hypothetical protein
MHANAVHAVQVPRVRYDAIHKRLVQDNSRPATLQAPPEVSMPQKHSLSTADAEFVGLKMSRRPPSPSLLMGVAHVSAEH